MDARQKELMERFPWYGPHLAYLRYDVDYKPKKANLQEADLRWVDLREADLREAKLQWVDLRWAKLQDVDLRRAKLQWADLRWTDLRWVKLQLTDLRGTKLQRANLRQAKLQRSDLREADIAGADLQGTESGSICRMDFGGWSICIREDKTSIGCKTFNNEFWLDASDDEISRLDDDALTWWKIHGSVIRDTIKLVMGKGKTK